MAPLEEPATVGRIAVDRPSAIRVFDRHAIDYAFHGDLSLEDACAEAAADFDNVRADLQALPAHENEIRWSERTLAELTHHIEMNHHDVTRNALREFGTALKDALDLGEIDCDTTYVHVRRIFFSLREDLLDHMTNEEQILFPYVRQLESAVMNDRAVSTPIQGTINSPAAHSMEDHDHAMLRIAALQRLADTFPNGDAHPNVGAMKRILTALVQNMRLHVHLENNILFAHARSYESGESPNQSPSLFENPSFSSQRQQ